MRRRFLCSACAALGLVAAGCGSDSTSSPASTPATTVSLPATTVPDTTVPVTELPTTAPVTADTTPVATEVVRVYFIAGEYLQVEGRSVAAATAPEAVRALLAGPTAAERAAGATSMIPDGTTLNGIIINGNEATVDLSAEFNTGGGSLSVTARVAQVVFTVTQFEGIDTVHFAIDGTVVHELTGEGLVVDAVHRLDLPDLIPVILMETPWAGQTVTQPITVSGVSNTFEAQINYELVAPSGAILTEGWLMATSGTGTWGTFDATLDALPAGTTGDVTVRLFEVSMKDGEHINITESLVHLA